MAGGKIIPKMTWRQGEEGTKVKLNRIMLTYRCLYCWDPSGFYPWAHLI